MQGVNFWMMSYKPPTFTQIKKIQSTKSEEPEEAKEEQLLLSQPKKIKLSNPQSAEEIKQESVNVKLKPVTPALQEIINFNSTKPSKSKPKEVFFSLTILILFRVSPKSLQSFLN